MKKSLYIITVVTVLIPMFSSCAASSRSTDDKQKLVTIYQGEEQWPYQLAFHRPTKPASPDQLFCCIVSDPNLSQFPSTFAENILSSHHLHQYNPHTYHYNNSSFVLAVAEVSKKETPEALRIKDQSLPLLAILIVIQRDIARLTYHGPSGAAISNNIATHFEDLESHNLVLLTSHEPQAVQHKSDFFAKSSIQTLINRKNLSAVQQAKETYLRDNPFTLGLEVNYKEVKAYFDAKSATSEDDEPDLSPRRSETINIDDNAPITTADQPTTSRCILV